MVLPSLNNLVRIRRKIGSSSAKMPKVKARLLMKYPSSMKLLWNQSQNTYVKEDFLPPSFLQTQEDYDMEDSSSTVVHAGWDEENSGMNVARQSSMPFRYGSFKECPF